MSRIVKNEITCDVCRTVQPLSEFECRITVEILNMDVCRTCAPKTTVKRLFELMNERS